MKGLSYILMLVCSLLPLGVLAQQKQIRANIRSGNRYYRQENYKKAEAEYRKAYEKDSSNLHVLYNLGTALTMERELQEAGKMLAGAAGSEKARNKKKGAKVFHNLGVILQSAQQYDKAIEAYKQALRDNPTDEETRYNLVLCQKQLKNQQKNQQNQQNQNQNKDQNKDQQNQQQPQNQNQQNQDKDKQKQQQKQDQLSKENAQQLLEAVKQEEKNVKNKMNQHAAQPKSRRKSKDW